MDPFLQKFFPEVIRQKADAQHSASNEYCQYDNELLQVQSSDPPICCFISKLCLPLHTHLTQFTLELCSSGSPACSWPAPSPAWQQA